MSEQSQSSANVVEIVSSPTATTLTKKSPERVKLEKVVSPDPAKLAEFVPPDAQMIEAAFGVLQPLFIKYRQSDADYRAARDELRKHLIEWRDKFKKQGSRKGEGFKVVLERLGVAYGISPRTAYRIMEEPRTVYRIREEPILWPSGNLLPSGTKSLPSKRAKPAPTPAPTLLEGNDQVMDSSLTAETLTEQIDSAVESLAALPSAASLMDQVDSALEALAALPPAAFSPSALVTLQQWCVDTKGRLREIAENLVPDQGDEDESQA